MRTWRIRELRLDDLKEASELWNQAMAGAYLMSSLSRDELESLTLGKQTFCREASFVAEAGREIVGFICSFASEQLENDTYWHMIVPGWIGALIVSEPFRGRGLGSQLLESAEKVHQEKGRLLLFVGGGEGAMGNFLYGLEEGWTDTARFFKNRGYSFARRTCFIDVDLAAYEFPQSIREKQQELEAEGFSFGTLREDEEGADSQFCLDPQSPAAEKSVVARYGDRNVGEVSNIRVQGGQGGYGGIMTHPEFRRRGIGKVMLATAVWLAKKQGASSMPLWTRPATYETFYAKLGFRVEVNYDVYAKRLPQDILSTDWIARYQDPR